VVEIGILYISYPSSVNKHLRIKIFQSCYIIWDLNTFLLFTNPPLLISWNWTSPYEIQALFSLFTANLSLSPGKTGNG
jgi:hypothetical protein